MDPHGLNNDPLAPEEAITVEQAIQAYTLNPANILGWEEKIGSIEIGKLADMVILDSNPLEVAAADISEIRVLKTVFGGEVIFEARNDAAAFRSEAEAARRLAFARLEALNHPCAAHSG